MTRYSQDDHWDALRACWDATAFGAAAADADIITLNRAAGAYAANEPENLPRREFAAALDRVRDAVDTAKVADPERAARVIAEREAKRLAAMTDAQRRHIADAQAAADARDRRTAFERAANALHAANAADYDALANAVRPVWEALPQHARPKFRAAVGAAIGADDIAASVRAA